MPYRFAFLTLFLLISACSTPDSYAAYKAVHKHKQRAEKYYLKKGNSRPIWQILSRASQAKMDSLASALREGKDDGPLPLLALMEASSCVDLQGLDGERLFTLVLDAAHHWYFTAAEACGVELDVLRGETMYAEADFSKWPGDVYPCAALPRGQVLSRLSKDTLSYYASDGAHLAVVNRYIKEDGQWRMDDPELLVFYQAYASLSFFSIVLLPDACQVPIERLLCY